MCVYLHACICILCSADLEARERQADAERQEEVQATLREQEVRRSMFEVVLTKYR